MIFQWPFQEPKLEVPAYIREYPHKIWPYMVLTYLQFRILEFPVNIWLCPIYCVKLSEGQWTLVIFVSCRVSKISHTYNCTTRLLPRIHLLTCRLMKARYNMLQHVTTCYNMLQHVTTVYSWFWSSGSLLEFNTIKLCSYVVNQLSLWPWPNPLMLPMGMSHDITCLTCRGVAIPSWDVNFLRGHATFGEDGLLYEVKWVEERLRTLLKMTKMCGLQGPESFDPVPMRFLVSQHPCFLSPSPSLLMIRS